MARDRKRRDLKARFDAAVALRHGDRREEAVEGFREVLRLDAADEHFARYWLAAGLLDLQQHDELRQLLERYEEPSALWRYAQTLLAYRLGGDSDDARRWLEAAARLDADFPAYLLGDSLVVGGRPVRFDGNRRETTHSLATLFLPAWRATPGAASWVRRVLRVPLYEPPAELSFPRGDILGLPRRKVTWQLGLRLSDQDREAPREDQAWALGIANLDEQKIVHITVIEEEPTPEVVWREVFSAMLKPMEDRPHRPARLEVPRAEFRRAWAPMLKEMSVKCAFRRDPQPISQMLAGMDRLLQN